MENKKSEIKAPSSLLIVAWFASAAAFFTLLWLTH
jgi:hypothetical protein